ncbi:MAG TPA: SDR family NAD(P)-dependent oxidoreductase [Blastocatellia bacterium]|nr:SDR family NAD(P)-dependent oxidoreductase [Blastocatellia bacterium]
MRLDKKVSIVTGGGQGIGRAIALRFASEGAAVLVAGTTAATIEAVAQEVRGRGGRAIAVSTDVADEAQVERMVASALGEFGGIDILVNNAGIAGPTALVPEVSREDWDRTLAVNLTGAFLCAKHVLPSLIERRGGRIINITSIAGLRAYALRSPYAASKWAMIGLTRTLAEEAGRYDITVNAIAPGPVRGPRIENVIRHRAAAMNRPIEEVERDYVEPTALKRMAEEDDIAAMAVFLASEEGRNITGETLNISSGYRLS